MAAVSPARGRGHGPVRLEYLAAVVQQTGEAGPAFASRSRPRGRRSTRPRRTCFRSRWPSPAADDTGPIERNDDRSQQIMAELRKPISMSFNEETPLEDVFKYSAASTKSPAFPDGLPIYVDPIGLRKPRRR